MGKMYRSTGKGQKNPGQKQEFTCQCAAAFPNPVEQPVIKMVFMFYMFEMVNFRVNAPNLW